MMARASWFMWFAIAKREKFSYPLEFQLWKCFAWALLACYSSVIFSGLGSSLRLSLVEDLRGSSAI